jgi:hypothetical protein
MLIPMMPFFGSEMASATWTTRSADAYNAAGELVPGTDTDIPIKIIAPQPVKADELQMLEDGERISDHVKTWTDAAVQNRGKITVGGLDYKVVQVEDRPIGAFRKIIMRRSDD